MTAIAAVARYKLPTAAGQSFPTSLFLFGYNNNNNDDDVHRLCVCVCVSDALSEFNYFATMTATAAEPPEIHQSHRAARSPHPALDMVTKIYLACKGGNSAPVAVAAAAAGK